ncbi:uncharacterized protein LOC117282930 [Cryptotermes secundus]|uniref:uncharacterized protein LOC117282930 n=1 Tax=Cryptotermes secundus TaxID=105785 RepID=UPI001454B8B1|nr:uncharacterized protein LOC117282930 [Cryptotermes secundus]
MIIIYLNQLCSCEVKSAKNQKVLSRKKRYLSFPEGSSAVLNLSFANSYIWDYSPLPRPSWNSLCEADIGFKLPNNSRVFYGSRTRRNQRSYRLHRSERLELFRNVECLLDLFGVEGRPCLIRTLCEAKRVLKPGRSLVEDILHTVFTIPSGQGDEFEAEGYNGPRSEMFCKSFEKRCPFSLLEYLLYD